MVGLKVVLKEYYLVDLRDSCLVYLKVGQKDSSMAEKMVVYSAE